MKKNWNQWLTAHSGILKQEAEGTGYSCPSHAFLSEWRTVS